MRARWLVPVSVLFAVGGSPYAADAIPASTGTVTIELVFVGEVDDWGAVFGPSGGDCGPADVEPSDEQTRLVVCVVEPVDDAVQFEVFSGFSVTGACGDDAPTPIVDSDLLNYRLDEDLRAACRVVIERLHALDVVVGVFSDLDLADDDRLTEVLLTDADVGSDPVDVAEDCSLIAREPVQEQPEVIFGNQYGCTLAGSVYTLRLSTLTPGANHTVRCLDDAAPRALTDAGIVVDLGADDDFCRVEIRDIDGPLSVSIEGTTAGFDPSGWSATVQRNGTPVSYVFDEEANTRPLGRCQPDRRCVVSGVAAGSYELVVAGPPGMVAVSVDGTALEVVDSRSLAFDMAPGVERDIRLVVSNELPATGSNSRTPWFAALGALLLLIGITMIGSARRPT